MRPEQDPLSEKPRSHVGQGLKVGAYEAGVSKADQVKAVISRVEKDLGQVEILVNNAGILRRTGFRNISEQESKLVNVVNVDRAFNCCKGIVDGMIERKRGKIINISSSAGRSTSTFGGAHYTTLKSGSPRANETSGKKGYKYGINVNAVCRLGITLAVATGYMVESMIAEKALPESLLLAL